MRLFGINFAIGVATGLILEFEFGTNWSNYSRHPFPSRTRKLSSLLPTILGWRRPGKIGSANMKRSHSREWLLFLL